MGKAVGIRLFYLSFLLLACIVLFLPLSVHAQEENHEVSLSANRYVNLKIKNLNRYQRRIAGQQKRLLKKISKAEKKFCNDLELKDSTLFAGYKEGGIGFDSISKIASQDKNDCVFHNSRNKTTDSLIRILKFSNPEFKSSAEINNLAAKLNMHNYVNSLINDRIQDIRDVASQCSKIGGYSQIEKEYYYGKSKMAAFKDILNEPSKAEENALEYLQGIDGFDRALSGEKKQGPSSNNDLIYQGFQTTALLQNSLQQKYGSGATKIFEQLNSDIVQFQKNPALSSVKDLNAKANTIKNFSQPAFKINPIKALPFRQRIEKQFQWQIARPAPVGNVPSLFTLSVGVAYKYTRSISIGVGAMSASGLGYAWNDVAFSFHSLGGRIFYTWQISKGLGVIAEYNRSYKIYGLGVKPSNNESNYPSSHNTKQFQESVLIGISQKYSITKKIKGSAQLLYDVWWQQKGLNSPIVIRFVSIK